MVPRPKTGGQLTATVRQQERRRKHVRRVLPRTLAQTMTSRPFPTGKAPSLRLCPTLNARTLASVSARAATRPLAAIVKLDAREPVAISQFVLASGRCYSTDLEAAEAYIRCGSRTETPWKLMPLAVIARPAINDS